MLTIPDFTLTGELPALSNNAQNYNRPHRIGPRWAADADKSFRSRFMRRIDRILKQQCWMDLFEKCYFGGRMRRLVGPIRVTPVSAASVIVGPQARVQMVARSGRMKREIVVHLRPKSLVPDLAASLHDATLESAVIVCGRLQK